MSLQQFFYILWARRAIVLAALSACLFAAVVTSLILPERYTGRARVLFEIEKPDPVTGQQVNAQFLRAYTSTQIALIKDYQIAEPVVDKLGWANSPEIADAFARSGAPADEDIRHWLAREIIRNTDASLIENSNILEITYQNADPDTARRVVDAIRQAYLDVSLQYLRDTSGKTADWYSQQLQQAQALMQTAENERAQFAKKNGIVLDASNTDLEAARLQALSSQTAAAVATPAAPVINTGGGISPAQAQLVQIDQQIAQAATTLGPNHPAFQALKRQRAAVAAIAAKERTGGVSGGGGVNVGAVNQAYERQKAKVVQRTPEVERVQSMTRDIEQKRVQLTKLQDRAAELRLSANVSETGMTPMGSATASDKPDFPNRPLIWAAAVGFGLFLGIALALLIELLGRRVRTSEDLEVSTGAPVLAEIRLDDANDDRRRWLPVLRPASRLALPAPEAV